MADKLIELLYENNVRCAIGIESLAEDIRDIFADTPPVKCGEWEEVSEDYEDTYYRCSVCGDEWYLEEGNPKENGMNFCPKCGYDMRGIPNTDALEIANVIEFRNRMKR